MVIRAILIILGLTAGAAASAAEIDTLVDIPTLSAQFEELLKPQGCDASTRPSKSGCCICFSDDRRSGDRKSFQKTCDEWFLVNESFCPKGAQSRLPFKGNLSLSSSDSKKLPLTCDDIRIYGAFHALPDDTALPFQLSQIIAKRLGSRNVCYDGLSCFVFKDLARVQACAASLSGDHCSYDISGNQNVGVAETRQKTSDASREMESAKSRLRTLISADGSVELIPAPCSAPGTECGWVLSVDAGSNRRDLNQKICRQNGRNLVQTCCSANRFKGRSAPSWSIPGELCR